MQLQRILLLSLQSSLTVLAQVTSIANCKCMPGDTCWPSDTDFQALNQSVSGNLIRGVPPGAVCYPDRSEHNETACAYVRDNWLVSTFHATNPISVGFAQWANNPCPPIYPNGSSVDFGDPNAGERGCDIGGYPVYALNATSAEDVQRVVRWAGARGIRVGVKSTGHSFTGRSTGAGSISIWTHYLQGIELERNFQPTMCVSADAHDALRIAAGSRVRNVYEAADGFGFDAVGGSAQDVGIVGWMTGGGHGPLTGTYGMGVDNVLEATVVTPQGDIVVANECQSPDLFWAIRGGGGGTFGIITELVMKAYPRATMQTTSFNLEPLTNSTQDLDAYWNATTYLLSEQPRLKAGGMSGYMFIVGPSPFSAPALGVPGASSTAFVGSVSIFGAPNGTAVSLWSPIKQYINDTYVNSLNFTTSTTFSPTFFSSWNQTIGFEAVGGAGAILGSRLLSAKALTAELDHLKSTVRSLVNTTGNLQVYNVAPKNTTLPANVSLNPAWRSAVLHTISGYGWLDGSSKEVQQAAADKVSNELVPKLKSLEPDGGAYFNEGDPFDPSWQWTFFGENYARLREVKMKYDPHGVLWCRSCVGSEAWVEEGGVGGRLCKVEWA